MAYAILRTAKLKTIGNIAGSLAHTYRTRETPNADPHRKNFHSVGKMEDALEAIRSKLPEKTRKNGVLCIEYLITASPEWDGWKNPKEYGEYFSEAEKWLEKRHGKDNIAVVSIHCDETTPHLIAYVLPYDGKGKLNAREFLGGKAKLSAMQTDFANNVERFGLKRGIEGSKAKHTEISEFYANLQSNRKVPKVDKPEPKLLESKEKYGDRVLQSTLDQITPKWKELTDKNTQLNIQLKTATEKLIESEKQLEQAKPYLDAMARIPEAIREQISDNLKQLPKKYPLQTQKQAEPEKNTRQVHRQKGQGMDR